MADTLDDREPSAKSQALVPVSPPDDTAANADPSEWDTVGTTLRHAVYRSPFYQFLLKGGSPRGLAIKPPDPWPGDPERANALFQGRYVFAGREIISAGKPNWLPRGASPAWLDEMHAFEWLRDFKAHGGEAARRQARAMVSDWHNHFGRWHPQAWRADVLGQRLAAWILNSEFVLNGAEKDFERIFLDGLARQLRHLSRAASSEARGARRFSALRGLLYGGLALGWSGRRLDGALAQLSETIELQILGDGGHIERSPRLLRRLLADLSDLRGLLIFANHVPPAPLIQAIDKAAPVLRMFRHGDGGLAAFNDTGEDNIELINATLTISDARGKPPTNAPHSGFQRVVARRTVLIVDSGAPARLPEHVHAGTLSFEMSVGRERLIVNCGPHWGQDPDWAAALRGTAAHSTLAIEATNSTQFLSGGRIGRRPLAVMCSRREKDGATWLDLSHDGYGPASGFVHHRRLYLDAEGEDLRGEDALLPVDDDRFRPSEPHAFSIRFHLHPTVQASLAQNGQMVLLRTPSGMGWQFRAGGGTGGGSGGLALGPGIYFGAAQGRRRTDQIIISGQVPPDGTSVRWNLRRLASS